MAFGQPSGPPASAKQLKTLLALLEAAGYSDFRDARGPMGFTQRQGSGKFTKDEADGLITALEFAAQQAELDGTPSAAPAQPEPPEQPARPARPAPTAARVASEERLTAAQKALRTYPASLLAAELQRRGWIVVEP